MNSPQVLRYLAMLPVAVAAGCVLVLLYNWTHGLPFREPAIAVISSCIALAALTWTRAARLEQSNAR
ncbi:hypothetical protein [Polymorphobacter megasporae]|uniref:hypothetical protein n=1 Tax=Glacieibacterium megasporae TaxID=2835787 RepID=UPI001C1E8B50|nr:hypothetical protein [Polymorphobacter megasporae]UAJ09182.1 hypothetical protein KTC28_12640 [Polymorphobacter megasporae]